MTVAHLDGDERRRRIGVRHRLAPDRRTNDITTIADDLGALHSSDPVTVYLSAWVRMRAPSVASVDAALYDARTVVRHHAMRRTIWVMSHDVAIAANASSTRKIAAVERRKLLGWLAASDVIDDPAPWLDEATERVVEAVRSAGTISTRDLGRQLPDLAVPIVANGGTRNPLAMGAHTRIPLLAAFEGRLVRARPVGSWASGQYTWAIAAGWADGLDLGADEPSVKVAAAVLVRRLLVSFGPVTLVDLQWWTGWTKSQTTAALVDLGAEAVTIDGGEPAWIAAGDHERTEPTEPWVALVPSLDATTMGWKQRAWFLDDDIAPRVFDRWGNAGPSVWADGRVVGGWAQRRDGEIALELHRDLSSDHRDMVDTEIERLTAAIGPTRFSIRFPSPSNTDLVR